MGTDKGRWSCKTAESDEHLSFFCFCPHGLTTLLRAVLEPLLGIREDQLHGHGSIGLLSRASTPVYHGMAGRVLALALHIHEIIMADQALGAYGRSRSQKRRIGASSPPSAYLLII